MTRTSGGQRLQRSAGKDFAHVFADSRAILKEAGNVPCFYFDGCGNHAVACKQGRAMCRKHLGKFQGVEFPLREVLPYEIGKIDSQLEMAAAWPRV